MTPLTPVERYAMSQPAKGKPIIRKISGKKAEEAQGSKKVAEMVRELSRLKYGRDMEEVEVEIERRAKL